MSITGCVFAPEPKACSLHPVRRCYHPQSHIRMLFVLRFSFTHTVDSKWETGLFDSVYFIAGERLCLSCCVCQLIFELRVPIKTKHHIRGILPPPGSFKSHIAPMECGSNLVVALFISVPLLLIFLFTLACHLFTHSSPPALILYTVIIILLIAAFLFS